MKGFVFCAWAALVLVVFSSSAGGQEKRQRFARKYPPEMPGAKVRVYKTAGDVKLNLYVFQPEDLKAGQRRAAIVFFFGGGWRAGSPRQFYHHCRHLASRGMVAMAADYRVSSRHKVKAVKCVEDAKSAIRWVRVHAKELGVDPGRVVAAGGSAGGHIAACSGTIKEFDAADEDAKVSSRPDAMVLFNPALALAEFKGESPLPASRASTLPDRMGVEPRKLSPVHHVQGKVPPTLILHGTGDTTVLFKTAQWFAGAMKKTGNNCRLIGYKDQPHGFFNYGRGDNSNYKKTVAAMDEFLAELGYLADK